LLLALLDTLSLFRTYVPGNVGACGGGSAPPRYWSSTFVSFEQCCHRFSFDVPRSRFPLLLGAGAHPLSPLSPSNILERLRSAHELDISSGHLAWPGLAAVYRTEHADDPSDSAGSDGVMEIKINSGGVVYFAVFQYLKPPREQGEAASGAPRRASLGGPVQQHVSQMAVTTSQEGPAVVVRAYGSQGMTQLSVPSPTNAQRPVPASPPLSPAQHGSCDPAVPAVVGDADRAGGEAHGLKVRVGPRMSPDSAGAGRPSEVPPSHLFDSLLGICWNDWCCA
jgi:hypothetical protein